MKGERSTNEKHVFRFYFPTASYLREIKDSQIEANDLHNLPTICSFTKNNHVFFGKIAYR